MDAAGLIEAIRCESSDLATAAERAPGAVIPTCPGWTMPTLVAHVGAVHRWCTAIVATGERVSQRDMPRPPEGAGTGDLLAWFASGADELCRVLTHADPEATIWTFGGSGDRRVRWWMRRQACETATHRWDAEHAAAPGSAGPIGAELALDAIAEYLYDFLPGAIERAGNLGLHGTLHLHATDDGLSGGEWLVDLGATPVAVSDSHAKADTALRGPVSDLSLWLWNRLAVGGARLEVFGAPDPLLVWPQLRL